MSAEPVIEAPLTGAVRDIVNAATQLGEDWRLPREAREPEVRSTIPPREKNEPWRRGDVVNLGRIRWIIRGMWGDQVRLVAANVAAGPITWNTTINKLPERNAA